MVFHNYRLPSDNSLLFLNISITQDQFKKQTVANFILSLTYASKKVLVTIRKMEME